MSVLEGRCNCCGQCCMTELGRCDNLKIVTAVGLPWATQCSKYEERYEGMPIKMIGKNGEEVPGAWVCRKNSLDEDLAIIKYGLGKGCSMELKNK